MWQVLLTGHNKSLVGSHCMDVPHPRSLVLDLTIIALNSSHSCRKSPPQTSHSHNSSIALWPESSLLPPQLPLTDWLGVVALLVDIGRRAHSRGCTFALPCSENSGEPALKQNQVKNLWGRCMWSGLAAGAAGKTRRKDARCACQGSTDDLPIPAPPLGR